MKQTPKNKRGAGSPQDAEHLVPVTPLHSAPPSDDGEDAARVETPPILDEDAASDGSSEPPSPGAQASEEPPASVEQEVLAEERLEAVLESLLFVSDRPVTVVRLLELLEEGSGRTKDGPPLYQASGVVRALRAIAARQENRGIELHEVAGGWQMRTASLSAPWVQRQLRQKPQRLTRAQVETLSIVAYRQPVTRPEIDDVRGVDSGGALKTLLDRRLVRILGKREEAGRPLLYGTTREFLEFFNLKDLKELPTLREYYELNDENKAAVRATHPQGAGAGSGGNKPEGLQLAMPTGTEVSPAEAAEQAARAAVQKAEAERQRQEVLDKQLADDDSELAKIDEIIAGVRIETPPLDVLMSMAEAAARGDLPMPPVAQTAPIEPVAEADEADEGAGVEGVGEEEAAGEEGSAVEASMGDTEDGLGDAE